MVATVIALGVLLLLGPLIVLGVWLWLRARRDPIALSAPLDIGRVLADSFAGFRDPALLALSLLLCGIPIGIEQMLLGQRMGTPGTPPDLQAFAALWPAMVAPMFVGLLFHIPALAILVTRQEEQHLTLGTALVRLPRLYLPVVALWLLVMLGIMLGFTLFVLPGALLFLGWQAAVPAYVAEDVGIFAALGRSRQLSIGSRGRILLLTILWGLGFALLQGVADGLARLAPVGAAWATLVSQALVGWVSGLFGVGYAAALYGELRRIREGAGTQSLAEIFA